MTTPTTPEGRLYDAGFTRRLEYWVPPGSDDALSLNDAIARLDSGDVEQPMTHARGEGEGSPSRTILLRIPPGGFVCRKLKSGFGCRLAAVCQAGGCWGGCRG